MTRVIDERGRWKVSPNFPPGAIVAFTGLEIPDEWTLCDGTNGTPDLRDRMIIGDSTVGIGVLGGSTSPTAAPSHTGFAAADHLDHVVTQPSAHSAHSVTQPSAHSAHAVTQPSGHGTHASQGAHTHDAHTTELRTTNVVGGANESTTPTTHSSQGGHTHDAHSAHAGMAVDAHSTHSGMTVDAHSAHAGTAVTAHSVHSVTQPGSHSILKHYLLIYIMKMPTGFTPFEIDGLAAWYKADTMDDHDADDFLVPAGWWKGDSL